MHLPASFFDVGLGLVALDLQGLWCVGSGVATLRLWSTGSPVWQTGSVALWHVGSSQIRDLTCVSCIGRWKSHQRSPLSGS